MKQIIPHDKALGLMLAGNATLIFQNDNTGGWRRYRIKESKKMAGVFHVARVGSSDKYETGEEYLGKIMRDSFFGQTPYTFTLGSKATPGEQAFHYLFSHLSTGTLNPSMKIFHTGTCCACGRPLTDPVSIYLGIGPQCRGEK